jgi:uncharacterized protein with FMN-binding domain
MSKPGKIFLSGGLILSSAAYALWQQQQAFPPPAMRQLAEKTSQAAPARLPVPEPTSLTPQAAAPAIADAVPTPLPSPTPSKAEPSIARTEPAPEVPPPSQAVAPPPDVPQPADPLNAVQLAPPLAVSTGRYADGEFVGNAVDDEWGPVQVKVVVRNGDIADVICIEYPFHRQRSAEISEWAIPTLVEETIKAQSAKVDWVSQASFTSDQFQKSLASALARAQKQS